MSDKAPAFQFYARDFLADGKVRLMSCEEVGAYLLLLLHQWTEGEIPEEISALAVICRVTPAKMRRMWAHLDACFQIDSDGKLRNPRMEAVRLAQQGFREKQRTKAEQRWAGKRDATAMPRHDSGIDSASPRHMPEACSASASATAKENTPPCSPPSRRPKAERASKIPDGFRPNEKHAQLAREMGVSLADEFAKFADHHRAKGSVFVDWDAALRTWLRRAGEMTAPRQARLPSIVTEGAHDAQQREISAKESAQAQALIAARERSGRLKEWARAGPEQRRRILNSIPLPERSQFVAEAEAGRL